MATVKSLLQQLLDKKQETLYSREKMENTSANWSKIGSKGFDFEELGFESQGELDEFLKEWIEENEYKNIA